VFCIAEVANLLFNSFIVWLLLNIFCRNLLLETKTDDQSTKPKRHNCQTYRNLIKFMKKIIKFLGDEKSQGFLVWV
jgi:hypothetical protein